MTSTTAIQLPADWRDIPDDEMLAITLADGRQVFIRLAARFAPAHVANIRMLARAHWWDGESVYRVQENWVAQWGDATEKKQLPDGIVGMFGDDLVPGPILFGDDTAHPLRHELVLRREVAVERHLVRARCLGDRFHSDAANALPPKQIVGGRKDALAGRLGIRRDHLVSSLGGNVARVPLTAGVTGQ